VTQRDPRLVDLFARAFEGASARDGSVAPSRQEIAEVLGAPAAPDPRPALSHEAKSAIKVAHAGRMAQRSEELTPDEAIDVRDLPVQRAHRALVPKRGGKFFGAVARSAPKFSPHDWTRRAWAGVSHVFRTTSAARVEAAARELPIAFRLRALAAVVHEQRERGNESTEIDFGHITARGIIACALVLFRESMPTKKQGFARVLCGVSQRMFAALFLNPQTGDRYSVGSLFATEIHGNKSRAGWVRALERAGAVEIIQPPASCVPAEHVGPTGHALAQYWITARATLGAPRLPQIAILRLFGLIAPESNAPSSASSPRGPP
jgi:hypothetical protein